jgi:hypothetical protein
MINSVRNTVQSVLNKNNYGYISPADFNLFALQAQMEMFEEYFSSYNKVINMENGRMAGTDYADIEQPIAEMLETFIATEFLVPSPSASGYIGNNFFAPSLTTTGSDYYLINRVNCYTTTLASGTNTGTLPAFQLIDAGANFVTAGVSVGDVVVNTTLYEGAFVTGVSATALDITDNIFTAIGQDYKVYKASAISEAEKVTMGKILMLNQSLLTAPSTQYPAYTLANSGTLTVYPVSVSGYGAVQAVYFRYPKPPKWTYISLASGEPVFDQSQPDYQDFELPLEDEYKLAMKILQYCGINIREAEVVQFAMAQEQHEQPTFSMQQ